MRKDTPKARFVRTLLASIGGYAVTWAGIDWFTDYRMGVTVVSLNLLAAVLAGGISYLQAIRSPHPRDMFGKMVFTFAQNLIPGLSAITIAELTIPALLNMGRGILSTAIGALFAALATLGLNASEDV